MQEEIVRGTILNPQADHRVTVIRDGALVGDARGKIRFVGEWGEFEKQGGGKLRRVRRTEGVIMPPMMDAHIHIAQWPIRGRFCEGVETGGNGRLIAGLEKNVFPEEGRDADEAYARGVVEKFRRDTLAQGVVGGAAYMTAHASATRIALENLGELWAVGMVLMDQNCPAYLRTDLQNAERDIARLAGEFGPRCIVTDRFAVSVSTELRQRAAQVAGKLGLSRQTHLNEQRGEKDFVEKNLYPDARSYADVYRRDGLFDGPCLCAHCIWMRDQEWSILRDCGCAVAHCPSSNALLGSGIMDLDELKRREIPWSICTDVGAGPSTSLLAEMASFLLVHEGRHTTSAEETLWSVTLGAAKVLKKDREMGMFAVGMDYSYVEADVFTPSSGTPGEGRGGGNLELRTQNLELNPPHPNPPPAYQGRGYEAEVFIRENLLGFRDENPQATMGKILDHLAAEGLEDRVSLQVLQDHLGENVKQLEGRVRRVVIKGVEAWVR